MAGVILLSPETAVAWADSAVFDMRTQELLGHQSKLTINVLAHAVLVGAGWLAIMSTAREVVHTGLNVDDIVDRMPEQLLEAEHDHACAFDARPACRSTVTVAGFSHRSGRLLAWKFHAEAQFAPVLAARWASPELQDFGAFMPACATDVAALAQRQVELLQEEMPDASAGALTIATVRLDGISVLPTFDLAAGAFLAVPPRLRHCQAAA